MCRCPPLSKPKLTNFTDINISIVKLIKIIENMPQTPSLLSFFLSVLDEQFYLLLRYIVKHNCSKHKSHIPGSLL